MLQLNTISSRQQVYLQSLALQYAELLPEAMAVHSLILMYDMLEALECTHEQIEAVFGPEVMLYLTGLLYGAYCAAEGIASPLAAVPLLTINGRPVPFLGAVDADGRIRYTASAKRWLNAATQNGAQNGTHGDGSEAGDAGDGFVCLTGN